ncbi:hypothetical protein C8034_v000098 [Colletotrichum sidae]|uniref:Uncharacterized protein n=1 Tax=Colletotrichum sidae TaxID=1347389 RepID=A0A4R8SM94_9PEZI|nr:hypothetical protein C8034_v000098 [Colletotrichum sidae]
MGTVIHCQILRVLEYFNDRVTDASSSAPVALHHLQRSVCSVKMRLSQIVPTLAVSHIASGLLPAQLQSPNQSGLLSANADSTFIVAELVSPAFYRKSPEDTCPEHTTMCHLPHNWNCCSSSQSCCGPGCCAEGAYCVDAVFGKCCPQGKRLCGKVCVSGECCGDGGCDGRKRCCDGKCCAEGEVCDYGERCVRLNENGGGRVLPRMGAVVVVGIVTGALVTGQRA